MRIMNAPGRKTARRLRTALRLKEQIARYKKEETLTEYEEQALKKAEKELVVVESRLMSPEAAASTKNKKYRGPR